MRATIYKEWKENKKPLGTANLKKKLKEGLPFIPEKADDRVNSEIEMQTVSFIPEKWEVEWLSFTTLGKSYVHKEKTSFWIRKKKRQGLTTSGRSTVMPLQHAASTSGLEDRFLKVNGIEIY